MDALAAYGSDSSSSSSSDHDDKAATTKTESKHQLQPANTDNGGTTANNNNNNHQTQKEEQPRKRRWDEMKGNERITGPLPPPQLADSKENTSSMILWDTDYLSSRQQQQQQQQSASLSSEQLSEGVASSERLLEQLKQEFATKRHFQHDHTTTNNKDDTPKTFAALLKAQHEFHNPRFLSNAATQCGITTTTMLGSNITVDDSFEEYEYRLPELEERARVLSFHGQLLPQQQQPSTAAPPQEQEQQGTGVSQFAQKQMEQALQKECQR